MRAGVRAASFIDLRQPPPPCADAVRAVCGPMYALCLCAKYIICPVRRLHEHPGRRRLHLHANVRVYVGRLRRREPRGERAHVPRPSSPVPAQGGEIPSSPDPRARNRRGAVQGV